MDYFRLTAWTAVVIPFFRRAEAAQVAALCYRREGIETEVLLVTSRGRGRWIMPKGWPMDGLDDAHAAAQEAWEEAGVSGHVTGPALGSYGYVKLAEEGEATACRADVYPILVTGLADDFPEAGQRQRKWLTCDEAAKIIEEPELRQILSEFQASDRSLLEL